MSNKSGFILQKPAQATIKKEGYTLGFCAPAGGGDVTITVADLEAALSAAGVGGEIVTVYGTTAPKGRPTINHADGLEYIATGEAVLYTDEVGIAQNVQGGEKAGKSVCLLDENCDMIPDETVDDTVQWVIPEGSCMVYAVDVVPEPNGAKIQPPIPVQRNVKFHDKASAFAGDINLSLSEANDLGKYPMEITSYRKQGEKGATIIPTEKINTPSELADFSAKVGLTDTDGNLTGKDAFIEVFDGKNTPLIANGVFNFVVIPDQQRK